MFPYLDIARQILTPILIVFCISKVGIVYRFLFGQKPTPKLKRPFTTYDQFANYTLLASSLIYLSMALIPKPNFFRDIGAETDSASFHIRRQCNAFMASKYPGYSPSSSSDPEILMWEKMCDLMVGTTYRNIYLLYGHALQLCSWCRKEEDFMLFALPSILWHYVPFLMIVGLCTMNWRRNPYRSWFAVGFFLFFVIEVGILNMDEPQHHLWANETQFNAVGIFRSLAMSILLITLYFLQSKEWTDLELLSKLLESAQHNRFRNRAADAISLAITKDQQLWKHYLKFQERVKAGRRRFHVDSSIKVIHVKLGCEAIHYAQAQYGRFANDCKAVVIRSFILLLVASQ
jgi:hypothetical protein